jgi:hypothetical protein
VTPAGTNSARGHLPKLGVHDVVRRKAAGTGYRLRRGSRVIERVDRQDPADAAAASRAGQAPEPCHSRRLTIERRLAGSSTTCWVLMSVTLTRRRSSGAHRSRVHAGPAREARPVIRQLVEIEEVSVGGADSLAPQPDAATAYERVPDRLTVPASAPPGGRMPTPVPAVRASPPPAPSPGRVDPVRPRRDWRWDGAS